MYFRLVSCLQRSLWNENQFVNRVNLLCQNWLVHALCLERNQVSCNQCDQKKSPNVYKNCPKMILLEKVGQSPINCQIWSHCLQPKSSCHFSHNLRSNYCGTLQCGLLNVIHTCDGQKNNSSNNYNCFFILELFSPLIA